MESNYRKNSSFLNGSFLYFQDNNVIMQFIPIILALFYGFYNREFVKLSHTVLGKLFAVVAILYYTKLNPMYGTFACVIAIMYYQMSDISMEGFAASIDKHMLDKCKNGVLTHKGNAVNPEMTSHVYPEIKFANDKPCNPCDNTCEFNIIESKLQNDEDMKNPKNSRDFMSIVHNAIMGDEFAKDFKPYKAPIIG